MHLSHVFENLEAWYLNFDFAERVDTTFRPRLTVEPGTKTVPQPPEQAASPGDVASDFRRFGAIGHSSSMQSTSACRADVMGADGTLYRKGTAVPQRADFNTLDNPFFWSSRPRHDGMAEENRPRLALRGLQPVQRRLSCNRLAMDGVLPDGTRSLEPRARGQGFNSVLRTTHRQNFLVPPRATARSRSSRSRRNGSLPAGGSAIGISAAVFLSGAVLLGLELVASRVLAPSSATRSSSGVR